MYNKRLWTGICDGWQFKKNHTDVCFPTNAGYIEYKGLKGQVRSGCPNTPSFKSRYWTLHKPIVAIPQDAELEENSADNPSSISATHGQEDQVGLKRNTRNSTFYQGQDVS